MLFYQKSLNKKNTINFLKYTCQKYYFLSQFNTSLTFLEDKIKLQPLKDSNKLKFAQACVLINKLSSCQIQGYQKKSIPVQGQSQNEYYKSLQNSKLKKLLKEYQIVIIPSFLNEKYNDKNVRLPYFYYVYLAQENKKFIQDYQKIDFWQPQSSETIKKYYPTVLESQSFEKFIALRLLGLAIANQLQFQIHAGKVYIKQNINLNEYYQISKQYILESQEIKFKQYIKIINDDTILGKLNNKCRLFYEIELIQQANRYNQVQFVKRDCAYYIRHNSCPCLEQVLENKKGKSNQQTYFLILQSKGINFKNEFQSQLKRNKLKDLKLKLIKSQKAIQITYKSQNNQNKQIFNLYNNLKYKMQYQYKIKITQNIKKLLNKQHWKSLMIKKTNELGIDWKITSSQNDWYLSFTKCIGQPEQVLKIIQKDVIRLLKSYNFKIDPNDKKIFELMKGEINKLKISHLRDVEIRTIQEDQIFEIEGVLPDQKNLEEVNIQIINFMKKYNISVDNLVQQQNKTPLFVLEFVQSANDFPSISSFGFVSFLNQILDISNIQNEQVSLASFQQSKLIREIKIPELLLIHCKSYLQENFSYIKFSPKKWILSCQQSKIKQNILQISRPQVDHIYKSQKLNELKKIFKSPQYTITILINETQGYKNKLKTWIQNCFQNIDDQKFTVEQKIKYKDQYMGIQDYKNIKAKKFLIGRCGYLHNEDSYQQFIQQFEISNL